ncbi:hypothetical protein ACTMTI_51375 [Nonomuraea sp. H19]|uniref:hypothetical protein n=1 Tax=Nonomuraea sp. H19 TaxID=3452206 RepID=UPI003F8BE027
MLDIEAIKRRVAELRIGEVEFRLRTGISLEVLRKDPAPATLSVEVIVRVCEMLDMEVSELLGRHPAGPAARPDHDDLVVEAALTQHGQLTEADLAEALRWPLQRVDKAIRLLALRLLGTAVQVVRMDSHVHLEARPRVLSPEADATLRAVQQARIPLSAREACVLLYLLHQRHDPLLEHLPLDWETTQVLIHRGLAEQDEDGLHPHPDLSFALALLPIPKLPDEVKRRAPRRLSYRSIPGVAHGGDP